MTCFKPENNQNLDNISSVQILTLTQYLIETELSSKMVMINVVDLLWLQHRHSDYC